ncbi:MULTISPECIES: hypothetical protein [unclassified Nonomuraea]|uniref:hypothetical protein n=1 Tax=unclassified Nonomuraea TaxID=2593643 RepID=UPI0035BFAF8C
MLSTDTHVSDQWSTYGTRPAPITALGTAMAAQQQSEATVTDVMPSPADDPRGAGFTASGLPLIFGGIMPAIILLRLFPGHANLRRRLTGVILFALVAGAAVLQYGFGPLHDTYWLTALGLALGMAALSIPFLALESLLGRHPPRRRRSPAAAHHGQDPPQEPRTAMRYVKPGAEAIAKVTEVLAPRRRTH